MAQTQAVVPTYRRRTDFSQAIAIALAMALALPLALALALPSADGTETQTKVRFPRLLLRLLLECNQTSASQLQPCRFLLLASIQHPAFRPSSRRPAVCQLSLAKSRVPILGQYQDQQIDRQM